MAVEQMQLVGEEAYRRLALLDPDGRWELHDGKPREKPAMSIVHGGPPNKLTVILQNQLGWDEYRVRNNSSRLRVSTRRTYIPDVAVVSLALDLAPRVEPDALELYEDPLPLVAEVWSTSTGAYDIEAKVENYQRRGDDEIWYLHPYERTLTAWVRQTGADDAQHLHREGTERAARLAGVAVDLAWLFAP